MTKFVKESPNITELEPSTPDNTTNDSDIIEVPYDDTNNSNTTTSQYSDSSNDEDDIIEESYEDDEDDSPYLYLESKQVLDSDGFYTDYTLYLNTDTGNYICMFGDNDLYEPDEDYADFVTDSEEEAYEWFEDYTGFSDDLDEATNPGSIGQYKRCSTDQFTEDDIIEELYEYDPYHDSLSTEDLIKSAIMGDKRSIERLVSKGYKVKKLSNPLRSIEVGTFEITDTDTGKRFNYDNTLSYYANSKKESRTSWLTKARNSGYSYKELISMYKNETGNTVPDSVETDKDRSIVADFKKWCKDNIF